MGWWVLLLGCEGLRPPEPPPEAAGCGRAYGSTTAALLEMHAASSEPTPSFVPKQEWVERCVALQLTENQLRCTDPRYELADPGCAAILDPVRDRVQKLHEALIAPTGDLSE